MTYPAYPYPVYPRHGQGNPWRSYEQAAANAEAAPLPQPSRGLWTDRYGLIVAVVTAGVTLAALVLAILGPGISARAPGPGAGWTRVFDGSLAGKGQWDTTAGGAFTPPGWQTWTPPYRCSTARIIPRTRFRTRDKRRYEPPAEYSVAWV